VSHRRLQDRGSHGGAFGPRGVSDRTAGVARDGLRDGITPLDAARNCRLGSFADLLDAERIVLNLHRAYADSQRTELTLYQSFADAVTYNGGPMKTAV
jgi:cyclase